MATQPAHIEAPAILSADGKHLGFMPVYHWRDLTGREFIHHGNMYRSEEEARRASHSPMPASWAGYEVEFARCSTFFEKGPEVRSRKTIWELIQGEGA
jgi:hypothetical protein